jgi:hypothetical protein
MMARRTWPCPYPEYKNGRPARYFLAAVAVLSFFVNFNNGTMQVSSIKPQ